MLLNNSVYKLIIKKWKDLNYKKKKDNDVMLLKYAIKVHKYLLFMYIKTFKWTKDDSFRK
jgi:hypothetical protein